MAAFNFTKKCRNELQTQTDQKTLISVGARRRREPHCEEPEALALLPVDWRGLDTDIRRRDGEVMGEGGMLRAYFARGLAVMALKVFVVAKGRLCLGAGALLALTLSRCM